MNVLLVHSEFLKQKRETRKVEEIKLDWFNKYLCVFILSVGGTLAYLIFCRVLRFRDRWLRKKNFASKKHAHERSNPRVATKLTGDFAIFYNNSWSHKASFSEKVTFKWGIWRQVLPGEGRGGGGLKETISRCLIRAWESKYSTDSFILSSLEASSAINYLCRNLQFHTYLGKIVRRRMYFQICS